MLNNIKEGCNRLCDLQWTQPRLQATRLLQTSLKQYLIGEIFVCYKIHENSEFRIWNSWNLTVM